MSPLRGLIDSLSGGFITMAPLRGLFGGLNYVIKCIDFYVDVQACYLSGVFEPVDLRRVLLIISSRPFCCADIPCYFSPELLLGKDGKLIVYSKARLCSFSWDSHCERSEAELISDMSMRIYSEASIAESPLLAAGT